MSSNVVASNPSANWAWRSAKSLATALALMFAGAFECNSLMEGHELTCSADEPCPVPMTCDLETKHCKYDPNEFNPEPAPEVKVCEFTDGSAYWTEASVTDVDDGNQGIEAIAGIPNFCIGSLCVPLVDSVVNLFVANEGCAACPELRLSMRGDYFSAGNTFTLTANKHVDTMTAGEASIAIVEGPDCSRSRQWTSASGTVTVRSYTLDFSYDVCLELVWSATMEPLFPAEGASNDALGSFVLDGEARIGHGCIQ